MSANNRSYSLTNAYQFEPSRTRHIKSRFVFKRQKGSDNPLISRTSTDYSSFGESTLMTLEGYGHDNNTYSKQDINISKKSRRVQSSLGKEILYEGSEPHDAFRSTLTNLSQALATLNEGDYLQWDNCNLQKSPRTPDASSKISKSYPKSQSPVCGLSYSPLVAFIDSRKGTFIKRDKGEMDYCTENRICERFSVSNDRKEIQTPENKSNEEKPELNQNKVDIRYKGFNSLVESLEVLKTEESLEMLENSKKNSFIRESSSIQEEKGQQNFKIIQNFPIMQNSEVYKNEVTGRTILKKRERYFSEAKKEDLVLPKLNIGEVENLGKHGKEVETVKTIEVSGEWGRFGSKWGFGGQFRMGKALNGFKIKENNERILEGRSLSKGLKEEEKSLKLEAKTLEDERILKETENIGNQRTLSNLKNRRSIGKVIWDEENLYQKIGKIPIEETVVYNREEKIQELWKNKGVVPKLTSTLKMKKDDGTRKILMVMKNKDKITMENRDIEEEGIKGIIENGKIARIEKETKNHKESKEGQGKKEEMWVERLKAQLLIDQKLKSLEVKYTSKTEDQFRQIIEIDQSKGSRKQNRDYNDFSRRLSRKEESKTKKTMDFSLDSLEAQRKLKDTGLSINAFSHKEQNHR